MSRPLDTEVEAKTRRIELPASLARRLSPDTPDVEAEVAAIVVRIQVGTIVFQEPAISTPTRAARPPVPIPGSEQRTAVVVAACDWAKRCFVRCRCRDL